MLRWIIVGGAHTEKKTVIKTAIDIYYVNKMKQD